MSFESAEFADAVEDGDMFACAECHDFICDSLVQSHCPFCHEGRCMDCGDLIQRGEPFELDDTFDDHYCGTCCGVDSWPTWMQETWSASSVMIRNVN